DKLKAEGKSQQQAEALLATCSLESLQKVCGQYQQLIVAALAQVGLAPSALLFTGGGIHAHLLVDYADQRECQRLIEVHKRLVTKINAAVGWSLFDPQCVDGGTRYCRCPGTLNVKYDPPRLATILSNAGPTFTLQQLEEAARGAEEDPSPKEEANADDHAKAAGEKIVRLLLPYWTKGERQALTLALAGFLGKSAAWNWKSTRICLEAVAHAAGDEELKKRLQTIKRTFQRLQKGEEVAGYTALERILTAYDLRQLE